MDKYCIDCKYYFDFSGNEFYNSSEECMRPIISPINGPSSLHKSPHFERSDAGECGLEGKFFKPIPPKPKKQSLIKRIFNL